MRFLPAAALVAIVWCDTSNENLGLKSSRTLIYHTQAAKSSRKPAFSRFFGGSGRFETVRGARKLQSWAEVLESNPKTSPRPIQRKRVVEPTRNTIDHYSVKRLENIGKSPVSLGNAAASGRCKTLVRTPAIVACDRPHRDSGDI